jgi:hypothetical protein
MGQRRHKNDTRTFEELTFSEQAKAITAKVSALERSVRAHLRRIRQNPGRFTSTKVKRVNQVARMLRRIEAL